MTLLDRPLKILHLAGSSRWTGAAESAATLAAEQMRAGHEVAFGSIPGSSFEFRVRASGLQFLEGFYFDRPVRLTHLYSDIRTLKRATASLRPDIIHCHLPHDHWVAALAIRRPLGGDPQGGPAIIRTIHRDAPPRHDLFHRWLVGKGTDRVIVASQTQRRRLIEEVGLPAARIAWVRGSVDLEKFRPGLSPETIRGRYNIPPEARMAGMVARMSSHRGHHWFIDTLEAVVAQAPTALYALARRGEIKMELVDRIARHPLARHLKCIRYRQNDLPETYAAMDVILLLVPGFDGNCRAMLEAMACGRPVIGARRGAMLDTIQPGVNGWLVPPNNRRALTHALIEALTDPERTRRMGEAARRHVEQYHSRQTQCRRVLEVYQEALAQRSAGRR